MIEAMAQPDRGQFRLGAVPGIPRPGQFHRHRDILARGHRRQEVEGLEDDADPAAARAGQRILVERTEIEPGDHDLSAARPLQPGQHREQRRFARSRCAEQRDAFPLRNGEIDAVEDAGGAQRQRDFAGVDHHIGGGFMHERTIALAGRMMRYAAVAALLQPLALIACDRAPPAPAASPGATPTPTAEAPRPAGPERLVLAFGDSLYAGYGLDRGQSLPDAVQARLRAAGVNATVVNAGVSGDTSAAGRQRLAFTLDNQPRKPDLVLLGLGGNDVLRQISPAETRANMTAMMDELKRRGIPVMLTGMKAPPNLGADYVARFDSIWPDLATRYGGTLYPFILDGVIGDPALMQGDRVHPNAAGVTRIADRVAPMVKTRLAAE